MSNFAMHIRSVNLHIQVIQHHHLTAAIVILITFIRYTTLLFSRATLGTDISKQVEEDSIKVPKLRKILQLAS